MPGVPSGRGCEACRAQKKKCDQQLPACSRCRRLQITCLGSGQKRYKFQEDDRSKISCGKNAPLRQSRKGLKYETQPSLDLAVFEDLFSHVQCVPSNETTLLTQALVVKLSATDDIRYHISWAFGPFIDYIPKRLGKNEALDAAVQAFVTAHSDVCARTYGYASDLTLTRYSQALGALRRTLDDPIKVSEAETLCAVMILLICHTQFESRENHDSAVAHGEGASQLLKVRGFSQPKDEFEYNMLLTLRASVILQSIINGNIFFSTSEWRLLENSFPGQSCEARLLRSIVQLAELIALARVAHVDNTDTQGFAIKARYQQAVLERALMELRERMRHIPEVDDPLMAVRYHSSFQRAMGVGIGVNLALLCVRRALSRNDPSIQVQIATLCQEALQLANDATIYRPLGASWALVVLQVVWCAVEDESKLPVIEATLIEFRRDMYGQGAGLPKDELNTMFQQLNFCGHNQDPADTRRLFRQLRSVSSETDATT